MTTTQQLAVYADTNAPWSHLWRFHEQLYCLQCLLDKKEVIPKYNAVSVLKHIKCRCYIIYVRYFDAWNGYIQEHGAI